MVAKILVVDDDASLLALLRSRLEANGYKVITAAGGKEALRVFSAESPDLILLDIMLPDLSGEEVLKKIKKAGVIGFVPVIFLTAKDTIVEGLDLGAVDYIQKPFDGEELVARIRVQLRIKQLQEELKRLSITDDLTGCYNRRYALKVLGLEIRKAKRYGAPLSCVMMDLDGFKKVNDIHGHDFGDFMLKEIAGLLRRTLREVETIARYGGDEFLLVLPHTSAEGAKALCKRLLKVFSASTFKRGRTSEKISISLGIASNSHEAVRDEKSFIRIADMMLYHAKDHGHLASWHELKQ